METFFTWLATILLLQSVVALVAAFRFARYALRAHTPHHHRAQPKAIVIVPVKGIEHDLEENVRALLTQDYREYELVFVTESEADPAHAALAGLIRGSRRAAWLLVAGEADGRGQKIHNLCAALDLLGSIDRRAEVIVFADADARPARGWLADLVAPLEDRRVGATTGFRWYLPVHGGFSSLLLSVWNASALSLLGERSSFAWGGSTAIRRENFERLGVRARWEGAVSDDYVLTRAVQETGQRIKFVPGCLTASHADASLRELLEFTTRQMTITRVYAPRVWRLTLVSQLLYHVTIWGGLAWFLFTIIAGEPSTTLGLLLVAVLLAGAFNGWLRAAVAAQLLPAERRQIRQNRWAYSLLSPVAAILYLVNLGASALRKRIVWRGIGYELISPQQTVIWHRPEAAEAPDAAASARRRRSARARSSKI